MDKIFISIPSYEDEELLNTILNAINMAKYPERLVFGLALQYKIVPEPDLSFIQSQCKIIKYDVDNRPGIIKIRSEISNLIIDEKYFLGIDAHTRFRKNWDEILINDHLYLSEITNSKIVIGERYDGWLENLENVSSNINRYLNTNWKFKKTQNPFMPYIDTYANIWETVITNANKPEDIVYKSTRFVSANYWFTTCDFFKDNFFPNFHNLFGEEIELSMALFCNGYDIYYPINKHIINAPKSETTNRANPIHWRNHFEKNWTMDEPEMCLEVMKLFITGNCKYYSFKNRQRSVKEYWTSLGFEHEHIEALSDIIKS